MVSTVARYGHFAGLFLTPRSHVNHSDLRTSSFTCVHGVLRANIDMVDVRTWNQKVNPRDDVNRRLAVAVEINDVYYHFCGR